MKRARVSVIRVAKIDPEKRIAAIIPIQAGMRDVKRVVNARHVGQQLVTTIRTAAGMDIPVIVCCCNSLAEGPIWRVRGSLPVRGRGILYGNVGHGPADFPGTAEWLARMIEFEPAGVEKAINDPKSKGEVDEASKVVPGGAPAVESGLPAGLGGDDA